MSIDKIETYCPKSPAEWRNWLEQNHQSQQSIWLVYYKVSTNIPSISWSEAVDQALCFGWIDSTKKTIDDTRYMQYFSKRKAKSIWSKINKDKVEKLIQNDLMEQAGYTSINTAKENGSWIILDDVEKLIIPKDLQKELNKSKNSMEFFQSQSKSIKKGMLYWVLSAKRIETRNKRISDIVQSAAEGIRPNHFR